MKRRGSFGAALCAAGMLVLAWSAGATAQNEVVYAGVVSSDSAEIRAGAGKTFYTVGNLPKGTMVEVHEVIFGWFKVVPPEGAFSYVSKAHVNAQGDGTAGVISFDKAPVRAAGADLSPKDCWRTQIRLAKDEQVTIIGEEGEFYKIAPPRDAYLFLPPATVRRATAAEIAAANAPAEEEQPEKVVEEPVEEEMPDPVEEEQPEKVVEEPAEETAEDKTVAEEPTEQETVVAEEQPTEQEEQAVTQENPAEEVMEEEIEDKGPAVVRETPNVETPAARGPEPLDVQDAIDESLQGLEHEWKAVETLPLSQQPVDSFIPRYRAMTAKEDLSFGDRRIVKMRLAQLGENKKRADAIRELLNAKKALDEKPEIEVPEVDRSEGYAAIGKLKTSGVYNGKTLPKLYRLVDPATERTIAYIRPSAAVRQEKTLGEIIGVFGQTKFDRSLKLKLISVEAVDLLEPRDKARDSGIARPTAKEALGSTTEAPTDRDE